MKRLLAFLFGCACLEAKTESIVTDAFLDKVAMIESNFNYEAVGDKGKANGAWQMHEPAWKEACIWLAHNSEHRDYWIEYSYIYKEAVVSPVVSRTVAGAYFKILENQMKKNNISVTPSSLYMAWNMGYSGARLYYFNPTCVALDRKRKSILARANHILSR